VESLGIIWMNEMPFKIMETKEMWGVPPGYGICLTNVGVYVLSVTVNASTGNKGVIYYITSMRWQAELVCKVARGWLYRRGVARRHALAMALHPREAAPIAQLGPDLLRMVCSY